jgi:hypothetical protein
MNQEQPDIQVQVNIDLPDKLKSFENKELCMKFY